MADELTQQGFRNVRCIVGGVDAWKKAGFPLAAEVASRNRAHG